MSLYERSSSVLSISDAQRIVPVQAQKHEIEKEFPKGLLQSLLEKNYEKRKQAGHNLQKFLKEQYLIRKSNEIIEKSINFFNNVYLHSPEDSYRQAGLMAFSAISSSLNIRDDSEYMSDLINPVLSCCRDNNTKVKYYAVEALYNIVKVCRQNVLFMFPELFKSIIDLCTGIDKDVKKATKKLDGLLRTIVVECEANTKLFSSEKFMDLIKEMATGSGIPYVQRMLVAWLTVLDSIPDFNLFNFIPNFLQGLFLMLRSRDSKLHNDSLTFLKDLLVEIKNDLENPCLNIKFIMETLVNMIKLNDPYIKIEAISWISDLIDKGERLLIKHYPMATKAALECLSDPDPKIIEKAENTNNKLLGYCKFYSTDIETEFEFISLVEVLMGYIEHQSIKTRIASLEWIVILQRKNPETLEPSIESLVNTLSSRLSDPEQVVVNNTLLILCKIAEYKQYFDKVISSILYEFSTNLNLPANKSGSIIKTLCQDLGIELVYHSIADLLYVETNKLFRKKLIEVLNDLLLTDEDFEEIREKLKYCIELEDKKCIAFFEGLYKAWCVNPGCTLTLTFLVQSYWLAYEMVSIL